MTEAAPLSELLPKRRDTRSYERRGASRRFIFKVTKPAELKLKSRLPENRIYERLEVGDSFANVSKRAIHLRMSRGGRFLTDASRWPPTCAGRPHSKLSTVRRGNWLSATLRDDDAVAVVFVEEIEAVDHPGVEAAADVLRDFLDDMPAILEPLELRARCGREHRLLALLAVISSLHRRWLPPVTARGLRHRSPSGVSGACGDREVSV